MIFEVQQSAGKVMATIFWDSQGILPVKEKKRRKLAKGARLLQDNASVH